MQPQLTVARTLRFIGGPKDGDLEAVAEWYEGKIIVCHQLKFISYDDDNNDYPSAKAEVDHHEYRCGQTNAEYVGKI